jgi:hypothetical protein
MSETSPVPPDHAFTETQSNTRSDRHFIKAIELIEFLQSNPAIAMPGYQRPYAWAYRGQADARWKLAPTALRVGALLGFYPNRRQYVSKGCGYDMEQMNGEVVAVRQFAELADRVGLPLPGFHPFFRQNGLDLSNYGTAAVGGELGTADWPKPDMLEMLAIAQHHGVPTRLLDFTYDPLIALFFAASDVVTNMARHQNDGVTELAVWCVNVEKLYQQTMQFTVVEVQRATNPYLRAQKGIFLLDRRICDTPPGTVTPSLDERIGAVFRRTSSDPVVVKLTLFFDQAVYALEKLAGQKIDRPHLMPSYDNVVNYLKSVSRLL